VRVSDSTRYGSKLVSSRTSRAGTEVIASTSACSRSPKSSSLGSKLAVAFSVGDAGGSAPPRARATTTALPAKTAASTMAAAISSRLLMPLLAGRASMPRR
jgi:hypothetical protein